jgi:hypothetical protein
MLQIPSDEQLYRKFEASIASEGPGSWRLAVFEGSPEAGAYSWCSDCVAASKDLRSFVAGYQGTVKVIQFKVGAEVEWEGEGHHVSPFKAGFPHLSDLPTVILFYGGLEVARMLAPRKEDYEYLSRRAEIYDKQIRNGSWKPPNPTSHSHREF